MIERLGYEIDLANGEFTVPEHKINSLNCQLLVVTKAQLVTALVLGHFT